MNSKVLAVCLLSVSFLGVGNAQKADPAGQKDVHYTQSQLKQMMREAHTQEQYGSLATYFDGQQKHYQQQAVEEKKEWERRSQNVMVVAAKYPRPVDSARYLYEYYSLKATEAAQLATKYGQLAGSNHSAATN